MTHLRAALSLAIRLFPLGVAAGCSNSPSLAPLPDAQVCIGCDALDDFNGGVTVLYCELNVEGGLGVCGKVDGEIPGIMCQSQNGQLVTMCPMGAIGTCSGTSGDASVQWGGKLSYYAIADGGAPAAAAACKAQLGRWAPTQ